MGGAAHQRPQRAAGPLANNAVPGGFCVRTIAFGLDYLVVAAYLTVVVLAGAVFQMAAPHFAADIFGGPVRGQLVGFAIVTLPVVLYFALGEATAAGGTWGKRRRHLRVISMHGCRIGIGRSLVRSGIKFLPWELSHTCIWQVTHSPDPGLPVFAAGFTAVWLCVGLYAASMFTNRQRRTLYDLAAGTRVVRVE